MAFFLYEDQEGQWQSRIDDMWLSIYDRANRTSSLSTAIFNRIGQLLTWAADRVFGERPISMRMVSASINLSAGGYSLSIVWGALDDAIHGQAFKDQMTYCAIFLGISAFFFCLAYLPMRFKHRTVPYVCVAPMLFVIALCFFTFIKEKYFDVLPDAIRNVEVRHVEEGITTVLFLLVFSLLSDVAVVLLIRKVMKYIGKNLSLPRILLSIISLLVLFCLIIPLPYLISDVPAAAPAHTGSVFGRLRFAAGTFLVPLNLMTGLYCLVPIISLLVLFVHRLLWPTLSKLIYPMCRYKIVTNRKVLVASGSAAVTVACNLEHVGIKDLLKLLS